MQRLCKSFQPPSKKTGYDYEIPELKNNTWPLGYGDLVLKRMKRDIPTELGEMKTLAKRIMHEVFFELELDDEDRQLQAAIEESLQSD